MDGWPPGDCQVLYTLVGLREPRKSDGSSDWPRVGRKRTSMDVGTVSIRRDPRKSTMCEYLAHKANLLGMKIAWCASMAAQLYISQETELEFEWWQALLSYSRCSALWTASCWIRALYKISFIHSLCSDTAEFWSLLVTEIATLTCESCHHF